MLLNLTIENFALIDRLEMEFAQGLNILTGETGAGKSIILDAIDAVLGGKVSPRCIRTGAQRALIEATFQMNASLQSWLAQQELAGETSSNHTFICSREISGRSSRSRVNGIVVNRQQMQALREQILEITAQGQTFLLSEEMHQRQWLDNFAGAEIIPVLEQVRSLYAAVEHTRNALVQKQKQELDRQRQLDLWQYQLQELHSAQLTHPEEITELEQEQLRLSHTVELQQKSYQLYAILYENPDELACADLLGKSEQILREMVSVDRELTPIYELVNSALAQVQEVSRAINHYGMNLEADPDRLEFINERLRKLKQICRKYGASLAEVMAYQQKLEQELAGMAGENLSSEQLAQKLWEQEQQLKSACHTLTKIRLKAAHALETQLVPLLKSLAMEKVRFHIAITPKPPSPDGADRVCFLFSANAGEDMQPLWEIASGGEMSRFFLALKTCFAHADPISTMIFDEIDMGVSGRVAQAIAKQLWQLSRHRQVLCVTHQPIIAAIADRHFQVAKHIQTIDNTERTTVQVKLLGLTQRKQELAHIASGTTDTPHPKGKKSSAIAFAESLLAQAEQLKTLS
jgi:DNA repair protein RecN (Recombination protein N)